MQEQQIYYQKPRHSFFYHAARGSLFAPIIALGMGVFLHPMMEENRLVALVIGFLLICLYVIGFVCSIIGIVGAIRRFLGKEEGNWVGMFIASFMGFLLSVGIFFLLGTAILAALQARRAANQTAPKPVITPPAVFQEFREGIENDITHFYIKGTPDDDEADIAFYVTDLETPMPKNQKIRDLMGSRTDVTISGGTWKGHPIEIVRVEEILDGTPWVTFNTPLPTLPTSIQITVTGPMEREEEIKRYLQEILARGVEGKSNW
jgi:hypothetical protein